MDLVQKNFDLIVPPSEEHVDKTCQKGRGCPFLDQHGHTFVCSKDPVEDGSGGAHCSGSPSFIPYNQ